MNNSNIAVHCFTLLYCRPRVHLTSRSATSKWQMHPWFLVLRPSTPFHILNNLFKPVAKQRLANANLCLLLRMPKRHLHAVPGNCCPCGGSCTISAGSPAFARPCCCSVVCRRTSCVYGDRILICTSIRRLQGFAPASHRIASHVANFQIFRT